MTWQEEIIGRYAEDHRRQWRGPNGKNDDHWQLSEEGISEAVTRRWDDHVARWEGTVPPRMSWATPDDLDGPAREAMSEWRASGGKRNLLILGPVGTGKSVAAFAILRHAAACGVWRTQWTSTVKLMERLRPSAEDPVTVDRWAQTDVLLLDDLGGEKPSEWVSERLFILFDERWQWERPTIVTSNLKPDQLRQVLGDRTYSRLQDGAIAVTLAGSDRRRAA